MTDNMFKEINISLNNLHRKIDKKFGKIESKVMELGKITHSLVSTPSNATASYNTNTNVGQNHVTATSESRTSVCEREDQRSTMCFDSCARTVQNRNSEMVQDLNCSPQSQNTTKSYSDVLMGTSITSQDVSSSHIPVTAQNNCNRSDAQKQPLHDIPVLEERQLINPQDKRRTHKSSEHSQYPPRKIAETNSLTTIPVHISSTRDMNDKITSTRTSNCYNNDQAENATNCEDMYDIFREHIVHKTKRFYLGGFRNTINPALIQSLLKSYGVKMTLVRIFPLRNSQTIIINVETENSHLLTEEGFWPEGITCRPWVSKARYQRNFAKKSNRPHNQVDDEEHSNNNNTYENEFGYSANKNHASHMYSDNNIQKSTSNSVNCQREDTYTYEYPNTNVSENLQNHVNVCHSDADNRYPSYRRGDFHQYTKNSRKRNNDRWCPQDNDYSRYSRGHPHQQYDNQDAYYSNY